MWSTGKKHRWIQINTGGWLSETYFWLLHDADAAVELTLSIVVVDVGVAAAHVGCGHGGRAAGIVGASVLN